MFVCDRENDRVQIFSPTGELLSIWTNVTRPGDLSIDAARPRLCRRDGLEHGGDAPGRPAVCRGALRADVSVRDLTGNLLTRWGGDDPCAPGSFASPHGICAWIRSGDLYVGEVTTPPSAAQTLAPRLPRAPEIRPHLENKKTRNEFF